MDPETGVGCIVPALGLVSKRSASAYMRAELRALPVYHLDQRASEHKLDQNEVPWDLPIRFKQEALDRIAQRNWAHYPDFHSDRLRQMLADRYGLERDALLVGNGSSELLGVVIEALVGPGDEVVSLAPAFSLYEMFVRRTGGRTLMLPPRDDFSLQMDELLEEVRRDPSRTVLLCAPNNPTGATATVDQVRQLLEQLDAPLLLDNAYGEFCDQDYLELLKEFPNLVVFRTFSKAWSLAGVRLGYLLADPGFVGELLKVKLPYNVNHASSVIGEVILENAAWAERSVRVLLGRREQWSALLETAGFEVFPSQANFILVRHPEVARIRTGLSDRGILVRDVSSGPGLVNCCRVAIGNGRALRAARQALAEILNLELV